MSYGISDHITAGIFLTPFGAGTTFKAGVNASENLAFSAGCQTLFPYYSPRMTINESSVALDNISPVFLGFGNMTIGASKMSLTLNYGYGLFTRQLSVGYNQDGLALYEDEENVLNMFSTSAMFEMTSTSWLMFEGYYIQNRIKGSTNYDETGLFMLGLRKAASKRRLLWDFAGIFFPELIANEGMIVPIPFVGLTLPL